MILLAYILIAELAVFLNDIIYSRNPSKNHKVIDIAVRIEVATGCPHRTKNR